MDIFSHVAHRLSQKFFETHKVYFTSITPEGNELTAIYKVKTQTLLFLLVNILDHIQWRMFLDMYLTIALS